MILRNSLLNFIGLAAPLLVAVFTIPYLIEELGTGRFGLLTLIWAVVSYFGLFDFGLGRALTHQVAITCSRDEHKDLPGITGTAYFILLILGLCAGVIMAITAPFLVSHIKDVSNPTEALNALYAMAVAMPFIVLTSGFRGVLEARHAFGIINMIRVPTGIFTFLGPVLVIWLFEPRLDYIAWALVIGRIIGCIIYAWFARRSLPLDHRNIFVSRSLFKPLCISGGWLAVSNVISPLMGYVDRFMIGILVSAIAVAYYATPNEIVTKLWIIPGALTAVLFPTFAAQMSRGSKKAQALFSDTLYWLFIAMLPIILAIFLFSYEILEMWINDEFANNSSEILQILVVGLFINSMAHIPFTFIQSSGHARVTAIIHLAEFPVFMFVLWWLINEYGVMGAAWAWLLRMVVDTTLMFAYAIPILGARVNSIINIKSLFVLVLVFLAFWTGLYSSVATRTMVLVAVTVVAMATLLPSIRAIRLKNNNVNEGIE